MKHLITVLMLGIGISMITCMGAYLSVPEEYLTIQAAIDAAQQGDSVLVNGGLYSGPGNRDIDFRGKAITVRARAQCTIDCESVSGDPHVGFTFFTGEPAATRLEGFTIINAGHHGDWPSTAAICIQNQSSPTIVNCRINQCLHGVIVRATCNPIMANCTISANAGGGIDWAAHCRGSIVNCLIADNDGYGLAFGHIGEPNIVNCTITGNSGYGVMFDESDTPLRNCIISNNTLGSIDATISQPDIQYCIIAGGFSGEGNIDADPLFVDSANGDYHLSQIASGQAVDSPGVDSGATLADQVCFDTWQQTVCLDQLSTRTDEIPDSGQIDMGYHYYSSMVPTPTPVPSEYVSLTIDLPASPLMSGSEFYITLLIENDSGISYTDVPVIMVLEVSGLYVFWPTWTMSLDWTMWPEIPTGASQIPVFTSFVWPSGVPSGTANFYSVIMHPEMTDFLSNLAVGTLSW